MHKTGQEEPSYLESRKNKLLQGANPGLLLGRWMLDALPLGHLESPPTLACLHVISGYFHPPIAELSSCTGDLKTA